MFGKNLSIDVAILAHHLNFFKVAFYFMYQHLTTSEDFPSLEPDERNTLVCPLSVINILTCWIEFLWETCPIKPSEVKMVENFHSNEFKELG